MLLYNPNASLFCSGLVRFRLPRSSQTNPYLSIYKPTYLSATKLNFIYLQLPVQYTCVYIYIHTHPSTYVHTYMHTYRHPSIHPSIHACMHHACMHARNTYIYIHTLHYVTLHTHTHTHIQTDIQTYTNIYALHTYIITLSHSHILTYTF